MSVYNYQKELDRAARKIKERVYQDKSNLEFLINDWIARHDRSPISKEHLMSHSLLRK